MGLMQIMRAIPQLILPQKPPLCVPPEITPERQKEIDDSHAMEAAMHEDFHRACFRTAMAAAERKHRIWRDKHLGWKTGE